MSDYPIYTHFWDGIDGSGWHIDHQIKDLAMKAHSHSIKSRTTFRSRVRVYLEQVSGETIAEWTREEKSDRSNRGQGGTDG